MPVEGPLPQTGDQHDINADADRCFRVRSPRNWRTRDLEGTDDYGLDYQVQTTPSQRVTDIFRVQLKGTRSPDISADGRFISIQLKASTIRYYDRLVEPILLVVCNLKADPEPVDCPLYYVWLRDELRRIDVANLPADQLSNAVTTVGAAAAAPSAAGEPVVASIYQLDGLVRRSTSLQLTADARMAREGVAA